MQSKDQLPQQEQVPAAPVAWAESEDRFLSPEQLDAQFADPEDDGGGGGRLQRHHGIGPGSVVMALASAGFRGPINPLCLQHLVEVARDHGLQAMVERVYDDTGLTYLPTAKWWFCQAMLAGKGANR